MATKSEIRNHPSPSNLSVDSIERVASRVADSNKFGVGGDVHKLAKDLGGKIDYNDFFSIEESSSGTLIVNAENNFSIILPTITSPVRDNFTIAHELGHYFLHFLYPRAKGIKDIDTLIARRDGNDRVEIEANWFAAQLLMPRDFLKQEYARLKAVHSREDVIAHLSRLFRVSKQALSFRFKLIGIS